MPADERPYATALSVERIPKEALALVDEAGLGALTTRALGHRLGVDATAVYRRFRNKDELVNALADRIIGSGAPPPGSTDGNGRPRSSSAPPALPCARPCSPTRP